MVIVVVLIFGEIKIKKVDIFKVSRSQVFTLFMIGICSASFNYFMQVAFNIAPNVGYVNAVNAASISLLTLSSAILYKDELSLKKLMGILGVTFGLFVLFL